MPTGPREIETPTGPAVGNLFGKMEILGISSFLTQTGNQPNHRRQWGEIIDIPVPVGTHAIVVSQDYWALGFGSLSSVLDPLDPNSSPSWNSTDHNLGVGRASATVLDINAADLTAIPPKQTAQIGVRMSLLDKNGDDRWFGLLGFTTTFLGLAPRTKVVGAIGAKAVEAISAAADEGPGISFHAGKRTRIR